MNKRNTIKENVKSTVKSTVPSNCLTDLRIAYRMGLETINGIKRTGWMNVAIITSMAGILTIFGAMFRATLSVSSFAKEFGNVLEISAYLDRGANPQQVSSQINKIMHVQNVKFIPKAQAWQKLKSELDLADLENPLPDTLHIKVDKPENIESVYNIVKQVNGVEDLNYAKDIAQKMQIFNHVVSSMTLLIIVIVGFLTIVIINNTIHFVIQLRKDEIEIMRLMGVDNWYIKIPLIAQGAIYGFLGALIALMPLNAVQNGLIKVHQFFMIPSPVLAMNIVVFILFVVATGFGALGSYMSIKKHLQV